MDQPYKSDDREAVDHAPIAALLIEDDEDDFILTRETLARITRQRYELTWVDGFDKALNAMLTLPHDVCLMDFHLGPRTGVELTLEASAAGYDRPIVMFTGHSLPHIDEMAMKAGAAEFLPKGDLTPDRLERAIRYAIERKRVERYLALSQDYYRGFSQFTTSIVHNVGNLLNSLKTIFSDFQQRLPTARHKKYQQAVDLLLERATSGFEDPKGQALLSYFQQFGQSLDQLTTEWGRDIERGMEALDLIDQMILAQQSYARNDQERHSVDLGKAIRVAARINGNVMRTLNIDLKIDTPLELSVLASRGKLIHVLINLIKNAIEAMADTPQDLRRIQIEARPADIGATVSIRDSGAGFTQEQLQRACTYGYTTKTTGNGFGLYYCAKTMTSLGGELLLDSDGPGRGATVTLKFP